MLLLEVVRIKLGQGVSTKGAEEFMAELNKITSGHPLNDASRILDGTSIQVTRYHNAIHLSDIQSHDPGSGKGTAAMRKLLSMADKHNVKITAFAKAYSSNDKFITDTKQLIEWYRKLGFRQEHEEDDVEDYEDGVDLVYHPR